MNTKIIKSLSDKTPAEIDGGGVAIFRSWHSIANEGAVKNIITLRADEIVTGLIADEDGVKFRIGKKQ